MNQIVRAPVAASDASSRPILSDDILKQFAARAPEYDRENSFFHEDLADLRAAGYLRLAIPKEFGGLGYSVADIVREQARLAYHAPSTALAINMHLYWTGAAAYLWEQGDHTLDWLSREAGAGKIFAAGHGEIGNDLGLANSSVTAEPLGDGSYRFTGRKIFTSLSPVWDWLGLHGLDNSDPAQPKIVHAFIRRQDGGHRTELTWDTIGVRATRSDDTILDGAVAHAPYVARVLPAGPPDDPFIGGILSTAIPGIAAVYYGIAKRAFDLAIGSAQRRVSASLGGKTYAHHPYTQRDVAQAAIELDSIWALLDRTARDWANGVDHGELWPAKIFTAKQHAVDGARRVVDLATKIAGASSLYKRNELERLYRDVRSGPFHPPTSDVAYDLIGRSYLGVLNAAK
ncbi:acyl-CoA dehydrogenase family protein [Bradyrhizobium sp. HKCCYLR20261]|uniref:acyl-CoA dehydrogenase family protein n=1 Tax=Bradyrhizobium sp. HKCCYLR20261 TaxID=3420760 RepID=UPI003EBD0E71